jgi:hypothetical protein
MAELNVAELSDGDVIVVRVATDDDEGRLNAEEIFLEVNDLITKHNPTVDVTMVMLQPGDNLETLDVDDMRRFGWIRS